MLGSTEAINCIPRQKGSHALPQPSSPPPLGSGRCTTGTGAFKHLAHPKICCKVLQGVGFGAVLMG